MVSGELLDLDPALVRSREAVMVLPGSQLHSSKISALRIVAGNPLLRRTSDRGITHTRSQDGLHSWSYTTCLGKNGQHPEVLIAGLDPFLSNILLMRVLDRVAAGETFDEKHTTDGLLYEYTFAFRRLSAQAAATLMPGQAVHAGPRALQLIYPDARNRLPWHPGYNRTWAGMQPLLFTGRALRSQERVFLQAAAKRQAGDRRTPSPAVALPPTPAAAGPLSLPSA